MNCMGKFRTSTQSCCIFFIFINQWHALCNEKNDELSIKLCYTIYSKRLLWTWNLIFLQVIEVYINKIIRWHWQNFCIILNLMCQVWHLRTIQKNFSSEINVWTASFRSSNPKLFSCFSQSVLINLAWLRSHRVSVLQVIWFTQGEKSQMSCTVAWSYLH